MNYAEASGRWSGRAVTGLAVVVLFHIALIYALANGLGQAVVTVVRAPLETRLIEEERPKPPEPPPLPDLPPPVMAPPPYVPPPDIRIDTPPPKAAIKAVTRVAPPSPVPAPVAPAAPPAPAVPDRAVGARPIGGGAPVYPSDYEDTGREGEVWVNCDVGADGATGNCALTKVIGGAAFGRSALEFVSRHRYSPATHNGMPVPEPHHVFHIVFSQGG